MVLIMSAQLRHIAPQPVCDLLGDPRFCRTYSCRPVAKEPAVVCSASQSPEIPKLKIELLEKVSRQMEDDNNESSSDDAGSAVGDLQEKKTDSLRSASRTAPKTEASNYGSLKTEVGFRRLGKFYKRKERNLTDQLEEQFAKDRYIRGDEKKRLAKQLGLTAQQVRIWFQNRRVKDRRHLKRRMSSLEGLESSQNKRRRKSRATPPAFRTEESQVSSMIDSEISPTDGTTDVSVDTQMEQQDRDSESSRKIIFATDSSSHDSENEQKETIDNIIEFIMSANREGTVNFATPASSKAICSERSPGSSEQADDLRSTKETQNSSPTSWMFGSKPCQTNNVAYRESGIQNCNSRSKPKDCLEDIKISPNTNNIHVSPNMPINEPSPILKTETDPVPSIPDPPSNASSNVDAKTTPAIFLTSAAIHPFNTPLRISVPDQSLPYNSLRSKEGLLMTSMRPNAPNPNEHPRVRILRPRCVYPNARLQPGLNPIHPLQYHRSPAVPSHVPVNTHSPLVPIANMSAENFASRSQHQVLRPGSKMESHVFANNFSILDPNFSPVSDSEQDCNSDNSMPLAVRSTAPFRYQTSIPVNTAGASLNFEKKRIISPDSSIAVSIPTPAAITDAVMSNLHQALTHANVQRVPDVLGSVSGRNGPQVPLQNGLFRVTPHQPVPHLDPRNYIEFPLLCPPNPNFHQTYPTPEWESSSPLDLSTKKSSPSTRTSPTHKKLRKVHSNQPKVCPNGTSKSWWIHRAGHPNARMIQSDYNVPHSSGFGPYPGNIPGGYCWYYSCPPPPVAMYRFPAFSSQTVPRYFTP